MVELLDDAILKKFNPAKLLQSAERLEAEAGIAGTYVHPNMEKELNCTVTLLRDAHVAFAQLQNDAYAVERAEAAEAALTEREAEVEQQRGFADSLRWQAERAEAALALPQPTVADEERAREIMGFFYKLYPGAVEPADYTRDKMKIARALAAVRAEQADWQHHVEMLLPLAAGYVAANPDVRSTRKIVAAAETAIRNQVRP